jgi:hypothetical protein
MRKPRVPAALDQITDVVLAYRPKPKTKAAKRRALKKKRDAAGACCPSHPPCPAIAGLSTVHSFSLI